MEKKYKIELDEKELNLALAALQELPHKTVNDLIHNIVQQVKVQGVSAENKKEDKKK